MENAACIRIQRPLPKCIPRRCVHLRLLQRVLGGRRRMLRRIPGEPVGVEQLARVPIRLVIILGVVQPLEFKAWGISPRD